jgi:hypothetical protein
LKNKQQQRCCERKSCYLVGAENFLFIGRATEKLLLSTPPRSWRVYLARQKCLQQIALSLSALNPFNVSLTAGQIIDYGRCVVSTGVQLSSPRCGERLIYGYAAGPSIYRGCGDIKICTSQVFAAAYLQTRTPPPPLPIYDHDCRVQN